MEDKRFSLTRVRLTNYKSIASADVSLGNLLFLVGPNGSGKSNFLDALRLTSESLLTSIDQALRSRGGASEVRRRAIAAKAGSRQARRFVVDLEFRSGAGEGAYGFEIETSKDSFRVHREHCEIRVETRQDEAGRDTKASFVVADGQLESSTESVMPPVSNRRLYLVAAAGLEVFRPVFDGLAGLSVFNLNPDSMRQPQAPDSGEFLDRDGANVASVLFRLDGNPESRLTVDRIDAYLQSIVSGMHVEPAKVGTWETLEFRQDALGAPHPWRFQAGSVSDGTLRAVGVLVALFAENGSTLSPVGIEEPESALHPAATGVLLDALRDASERRQVIVTSHSPDLIDRHDFDLSELRAVRSIDGETVIGKLDPAGAQALREDLYTPGELLRTDQLLPAKRENAEAQ